MTITRPPSSRPLSSARDRSRAAVRTTLLACSLLALSLPRLATAGDVVHVTPLEAGHVGEIHTGGVPESVELKANDAQGVYVVHTRRGKEQYRVEVNAVHGRLLSIAKIAEGRDELTYRWPGVRVVAHRGGARLGPPENTVPAIEKAIEVGADLIEIDIRQTRDGHLVLMHDETVDRTTDGAGRVDRMTLEQVRQLTVRHAGEAVIRVPTLEEALQAMRGKIDPDLDFKEGDLGPLLRVVHGLDLASYSTMYGSWDRCLEVARLEPSIRIRPTANYPSQVPDVIHQLRPALVNMDWHTVTEEAVRRAHLGGCHAFVNCLEIADTEFCINRAIEIGADYIQSDRPDVVIRLLKERGLRGERPPRGDVLQTPLRHERLRYPLR